MGKCLFLHLAPGVANLSATVAGLAAFWNPSLPPELFFGVFVNVFVLAVYHFDTPWMIPVRTLGILPLIYTTIHTRNVRPGIAAHCLVNLANFADVIARRIGTQ